MNITIEALTAYIATRRVEIDNNMSEVYDTLTINLLSNVVLRKWHIITIQYGAHAAATPAWAVDHIVSLCCNQ